jgi:hypothetical protein
MDPTTFDYEDEAQVNGLNAEVETLKTTTAAHCTRLDGIDNDKSGKVMPWLAAGAAVVAALLLVAFLDLAPAGPEGKPGKDGQSVDLTESLSANVSLTARIAALEARPAVVTPTPTVAPAPTHQTSGDFAIVEFSSNWNDRGRMVVGTDQDRLRAKITEWKKVGDWEFPIMENEHGLPTPVKGSPAPSFLKEGEWKVRNITLRTSRGEYSTSGWAVKPVPRARVVN